MKIVIMLLALMLVLPSFALAVKIKDVDIDPGHNGQPKVGDNVLITVKTDKNATKVDIDFPAVPGPAVKMQDKGGDKWQIKLKMSSPGVKKFKVTAYDKKGKKDTDEKNFQVGGGDVPKPPSQPSKPQPQPQPQPSKPPILTPATSGSVSGKLHKNSASGPVLSGVSINCGGKSYTTDGNGNFRIDGITAGNQLISLSKHGYESFQASVKVVAGKNVNMDDRWLTEQVGIPVPQPPPNTSRVNGLNLQGPAYTSENPFAKAGYGGQCTAFAWGRALEVTGKKMDTTKNGKFWFDMTKFPKGQSPKTKSIAVWGGDKKNQYGHVAFVEDVDNNGNATINEANFRKYKSSNFGGGYDGNPVKLTQQQMANRSGAGKLLGYIYLTDAGPIIEKPLTGSVTGKLHKNSASGVGLSGVSIQCGGMTTSTDGNGNFKLDGIKAGNTALSFTKSGYESFQANVNIVVGKNANVDDRWLTEKVAARKAYGTSVKYFSQVDPTWESLYLGNTKSTIGRYGCALTAKAMVFNPYNGTDPRKLNTCLTTAKNPSGYSGDLMLWNDACAPAGMIYKKSSNSHQSIINALNNSTPVIARVSNQNISSHYIVIVGYENDNYKFKDPLDPHDNTYTWPKGYAKLPYSKISEIELYSVSSNR